MQDYILNFKADKFTQIEISTLLDKNFNLSIHSANETLQRN